MGKKYLIEKRHTDCSRELVEHWFSVDDDRVSELWSIKMHDEANVMKELD